MQEGSNPESNRSLRESNTLNISQLVDHFNILILIPTKNVSEIPPGTRAKLTKMQPGLGVVMLSMKFSMGFLSKINTD